MFTGLIEEIGTIRALKKLPEGLELCVNAHRVLENTRLGDSIAVNGVCLTVTNIGADYFTADIMSVTLAKSSLQYLRCGSKVNLERALLMGQRVGGHLVSGHIDGVGTIARIIPEGIATKIIFIAPEEIRRLILPQGSIAIDGISLTVAEVTATGFGVSLIPTTAQDTTLLTKRCGDMVNLENDIIGKYVEQLLRFSPRKSSNSLSMAALTENGFM